MFGNTLSLELSKRIGSRVDIALDIETDQIISGTLLAVSGDLIVVLETNAYGPYGPGARRNISIQAINYIDVLPAV